MYITCLLETVKKYREIHFRRIQGNVKCRHLQDKLRNMLKLFSGRRHACHNHLILQFHHGVEYYFLINTI